MESIHFIKDPTKPENYLCKKDADNVPRHTTTRKDLVTCIHCIEKINYENKDNSTK